MQQFETARLRMRPLSVEDQELYCFCYTDATLMQHIGDPLNHDAALRSFATALKVNSNLPVRRRDWVMLEKKTDARIGLLSLVGDKTMPLAINADLGAIILNAFQGVGYSLEGTGALVDVAFGIDHIEALHTHHKTENRAVGRVMEKLGFSCTVENHNDVINYHWKLRREQWQANANVKNSEPLQSTPGSDNVGSLDQTS
jgi:RimJ/RimL family protein N-acetyltransferase